MLFYCGYRFGDIFFNFMEGKAIDYLINEQIRDKEVRVIGAEGNQLGVMDIQAARAAAEEAGLDLVRVTPNAKPPVCISFLH